jgi:hypothetical protein
MVPPGSVVVVIDGGAAIEIKNALDNFAPAASAT